MVIIMNEHAVMAGTNTQFDGMDRFEARRAVVEQLRKDGRIGWEKRPYMHSVGHCSRCETVVEPRLSKQWFVKVAPLAKAAGDAVRDGRVKIEPEELAPRYFDWIDNTSRDHVRNHLIFESIVADISPAILDLINDD